MKMLYRDPNLKRACDNQVGLFNELGFTIGRLFSRKRKMVELFTHAAINMWVILSPYILRRREDTGPWFAKNLLLFTLRCVRFVQKSGRPLYIRNTSGARAVEIGVQDLENIHGELKRLLADSFAARHL
jgi:hypothetical protein